MRWEESERRRAEEKDQRRERVRRKKMQVHTVVARSTFPSQNVQSILGPLLEVDMSKKCTQLWREARLQVKSVKKLMVLDHFWTFRSRFAWQAQYKRHVQQRC